MHFETLLCSIGSPRDLPKLSIIKKLQLALIVSQAQTITLWEKNIIVLDSLTLGPNPLKNWPSTPLTNIIQDVETLVKKGKSSANIKCKIAVPRAQIFTFYPFLPTKYNIRLLLVGQNVRKWNENGMMITINEWHVWKVILK